MTVDVGTLPVVLAASRKLRGAEPKDEQAVAVKSLCKTLNATVTKLLYAFTALKDADTSGAGPGAKSVSLAIAASKRDELCAQVADALACSVESVVRHKDVSLRSSVMRDLRVRFAPADPPKMVDAETQVHVKKARREAVDLEDNDDAILRQLRGEEIPAPPPAAAAPELPAASRPPAPSQHASMRRASDAGPRTSGFRAAIEAAKAASRPRSATNRPGALPGIYERQMMWASKKEAKIEKLAEEKEK